ncbi:MULTISPECIES: hypothetical protein [Acinetobacter]|uniref:hypothetical protein n=1 Tax=Acinetobacter TaxID=469 RepID=UPI000BDF95E4|nr:MULTISPECIES: hypothetical protein [Acinetobacter]
MNAIQFVQQRNIDEVREVLSMLPNFIVTHMTDDARMFIDANNPLLDEFQRSQIKDLICIEELKRLVESVDLVKRYGGIAEVKTLHQDEFWSERVFERLKQAIADYESIYGGEHV